MPNIEDNNQALGADAEYGPFNHFIIGIGGTGGRVVREFRKKMVTRRGNLNPPDGIKLAYLNVDSNVADLREMDKDWRVMNKSVALDPSEQFLISEVDVEKILADISGRPGIRPWLGDEGTVKNIVGHVKAGSGAQQIRRLGRLLFAANAGRFRNIIQERTRSLAEGGVQKVQFHLCASLAQGTGSGCIVDMISMIRDSYPTHEIFLYLFITDVEGKQGNFYSNQYSALQELNAFELGIFKPHALDGVTEARHNLNGPFDVCFLISDKNEDGRVVGISDQERLTADFLYEKLVEMANNIPDRVRKAHTMEDYAPYPNELGERCFNFGSFGIKSLSVPNIEVEEKIVYSYCENALNQLLYNVFLDRKGFSNDTTSANYTELVSRPADLEGWGATVSHLTERFQLPGDREFPGIDEEWQQLIDTRVRDITTGSQTAPERQRWADMLYAAVNDHYKSKFRELGVDSYYKKKSTEVKTYAAEVVRRFERDLIHNWLNDTALEGGARLYSLETMLVLTKKFREEVDVRVRKNLKETLEEESDLEEVNEPREKKDRARFQNRGWLSRLSLAGQTKALQAYGRTLQRLYTSKTTVKAVTLFGNDCLEEIVRGLEDMENSVRKFQAWFISEATEVNLEAKARLASRNGQQESSSGKIAEIDQRYIRYLDENEVEETMRRGMLGNEELARAFCKKVRDGIRALFHTNSRDPLSFTKLSDFLSKPDGGLKDILIQTAKVHASQDHSVATTDSALAPIMGLHVIDELFKDYGGEVSASLRGVVNNIMGKAKASLKIDLAQDQPKIVMRQPNMPDQPQRSFVVFLPTCRAHAAFRAALVNAFVNSVGEGVAVQVVDVDEDANCSDITIVTNTFWFSPRFISIVKTLKTRHLMPQIENGGYKERWKLYLEDHRPGALPDLLLPDDKEKVNLSRADLLLADVMGKLEVFVDDQEVSHLRFVERNTDGMIRREVDAHTGRVNNEGMIDFGLEVTAEHGNSMKEYSTSGLAVTPAHVVFLSDFERRFKPTSYFLLRAKIDGLVEERCRQRKNRDEVLAKLDGYRKTFFEVRKHELGRAPDNDETFRKWDVAVEVAKQRVDSAAP
jgi:hypothetical protein